MNTVNLSADERLFDNEFDPGLRELVGLSLLSGGGCSLALEQGDFLFVALFGAASIVAITEMMRRLR